MFSLITNTKFGFESVVNVCVFSENETVKVIKVFRRTVHCRTWETENFGVIADFETRNKGKGQLSEDEYTRRQTITVEVQQQLLHTRRLKEQRHAYNHKRSSKIRDPVQ